MVPQQDELATRAASAGALPTEPLPSHTVANAAGSATAQAPEETPEAGSPNAKIRIVDPESTRATGPPAASASTPSARNPAGSSNAASTPSSKRPDVAASAKAPKDSAYGCCSRSRCCLIRLLCCYRRRRPPPSPPARQRPLSYRGFPGVTLSVPEGGSGLAASKQEQLEPCCTSEAALSRMGDEEYRRVDHIALLHGSTRLARCSRMHDETPQESHFGDTIADIEAAESIQSEAPSCDHAGPSSRLRFSLEAGYARGPDSFFKAAGAKRWALGASEQDEEVAEFLRVQKKNVEPVDLESARVEDASKTMIASPPSSPPLAAAAVAAPQLPTLEVILPITGRKWKVPIGCGGRAGPTAGTTEASAMHAGNAADEDQGLQEWIANIDGQRPKADKAEMEARDRKTEQLGEAQVKAQPELPSPVRFAKAQQEPRLQATCASSLPTSDSFIAEALEKTTKISVRMQRSSLDESFGFQLGSIQTGLSLINEVHCGGIADKQTELKQDDLLLSVNDVSVSNMKRKEIVRVIKTALVVDVVVARGEHLLAVYKEAAAKKIQARMRGILVRRKVKTRLHVMSSLASTKKVPGATQAESTSAGNMLPSGFLLQPRTAIEAIKESPISVHTGDGVKGPQVGEVESRAALATTKESPTFVCSNDAMRVPPVSEIGPRAALEAMENFPIFVRTSDEIEGPQVGEFALCKPATRGPTSTSLPTSSLLDALSNLPGRKQYAEEESCEIKTPQRKVPWLLEAAEALSASKAARPPKFLYPDQKPAAPTAVMRFDSKTGQKYGIWNQIEERPAGDESKMLCQTLSAPSCSNTVDTLHPVEQASSTRSISNPVVVAASDRATLLASSRSVQPQCSATPVASGAAESSPALSSPAWAAFADKGKPVPLNCMPPLDASVLMWQQYSRSIRGGGLTAAGQNVLQTGPPSCLAPPRQLWSQKELFATMNHGDVKPPPFPARAAPTNSPQRSAPVSHGNPARAQLVLGAQKSNENVNLGQLLRRPDMQRHLMASTPPALSTGGLGSKEILTEQAWIFHKEFFPTGASKRGNVMAAN